MLDAETFVGRKVHGLLLDARPQRENPEMSEALKLACADTSRPQGEPGRLEVVSGIQDLTTAISDGCSGADAEQLLLRAAAAAQHWVTSSS